MLPRSGKDGYMIWNGNEIPIYKWDISIVQNRQLYRTAKSLNFPVRTSGTIDEIINIRGVDYVPSWYVSRFTNQVQFDLGWLDLLNGLRHKIPCHAMLNEFRAEFNYTHGPNPSFAWAANLTGWFNRKEYTTSPILPFNDVIRCQSSLCNNVITTTDLELHLGEVRHVTSATITDSIRRQTYRTAKSDNRLVNTTGGYDMTLDIIVQGDFDYWLDQVNDYDQINDYKIYYGSGLFDYWDVPNMKIISTHDHVVDIETGAMLQMGVKLGAAYG